MTEQHVEPLPSPTIPTSTTRAYQWSKYHAAILAPSDVRMLLQMLFKHDVQGTKGAGKTWAVNFKPKMRA
jgi:hypothetical protein